MISGHYQKADMHYKNALKFFPKNENILLEYSILKKNTNQTESAIKHLIKLKSLYPNNTKAREIIIEIYQNLSNKIEAEREIKELLQLKEQDGEYIKIIKKKFNLN